MKIYNYSSTTFEFLNSFLPKFIVDQMYINGNYHHPTFLYESILDLDVSERAKKGLFLCMQDPTVIEGVSNSEFLRTARNSITNEKVNLYTFIKDMEKAMSDVKLDSSMLHRSLNMGFSGGEKKNN